MTIDMSMMFYNAGSYSSRLCAWSILLDSMTSTVDMFARTSCPDDRDPSFSSSPPGPFCHTCLAQTMWPTTAPADTLSGPTNPTASSPSGASLPPTLPPTPLPTLPPTEHPTSDAVAIPASKCFESGNELRVAVKEYIASGGVNNASTDIARMYGHPIGTFCTYLVEDFSELFYRETDFNEPLDGWDTSRATTMNAMVSS